MVTVSLHSNRTLPKTPAKTIIKEHLTLLIFQEEKKKRHALMNAVLIANGYFSGVVPTCVRKVYNAVNKLPITLS